MWFDFSNLNLIRHLVSDRSVSLQIVRETCIVIYCLKNVEDRFVEQAIPNFEIARSTDYFDRHPVVIVICRPHVTPEKIDSRDTREPSKKG